jgi:hypothetical protein
MKKPLLNEEIARIRKIMGLNESEELDLSKMDNPNAYTDDIVNHNAEREYTNFEKEYDFDFEKAAIESASGEEVVQREFDDYDRPLYYSVKDDNVHYFIGDGDNGPMIVKYNAETGERYPIGDLKDYDSPKEDPMDGDLFEGEDFADHIKVYNMYKNGEVDKKTFYSFMGILDRKDKEELLAYIRSQEEEGINEIDESEISEGSMESGVYYDTTVAHEIKSKVGNLHKIAPYVLEIGDKVIEDISGKISVYDGGNLVEKFNDVDAFLIGIKYGATPV